MGGWVGGWRGTCLGLGHAGLHALGGLLHLGHFFESPAFQPSGWVGGWVGGWVEEERGREEVEVGRRGRGGGGGGKRTYPAICCSREAKHLVYQAL